jgi:ribosomal protein S24E
MCSVLLPPGGNPIAVKHIISYHIKNNHTHVALKKVSKKKIHYKLLYTLKIPQFLLTNVKNNEHKNIYIHFKISETFTCHILYRQITHTVALHMNSNNQCRLPMQAVHNKHYITQGTYVSVKRNFIYMGQTGSIANSLFYSAVKTLHIQHNKYHCHCSSSNQ